MTYTYDSLSVSKITETKASQTCGPYYYLIKNGATSLMAFRTKESFEKWLKERGLTCVDDLPAGKDEHGYSPITGSYARKLHMSYDAFYALAYDAVYDTKTLDNGDWVRCFITENKGVCTENVLNCNCKFRETFDRMTANYQHG